MEWILTSDRLPNANEEIIYSTRDYARYGHYDGRVWWYYSPHGYDVQYLEHDNVIAWMPMPEPYEMAENRQ